MIKEVKKIYKYIIPFYYTLKTRTKGLQKKIAYIFTYIIPLFILYFQKNKFTITSIFLLLISIFLTISVYEVGYLENDIKTVKKEKNPTLRLKGEEYIKVDQSFSIIIFLKYTLAIILIFFLNYQLNIQKYIIALIFIQLTYLVHNRIRNKVNLITFFILSTLRYLSPLMIDSKNIKFYLIQIIFSISLIRLLEKASEKKYQINFLQKKLNNLNLVRPIFYVLMLPVLKNKILIIYFLVYRILIYIIYRTKERNKKI